MQQNKAQFEQSRPILSVYPGIYALSFLEPLWCAPDYAVDTHALNADDAYTFFLCLRGKGRLSLHDKMYSVERGSIWFTEQNGEPVHWLEYDRQETQLLALTFSIRPVSDAEPQTSFDHVLADFLSGRRNAFAHNPSLCAYSDFFKSRIGSNRSFCLESTLAGFLLDCTYTLIHDSQLVSDKDRVREYLREHVHENISVSDLAKLLSISERSLFYFFRKNFGISPNDFINSVRMSSAAECLQKGLSVKEVSEMFKFTECSSFSRMFKKIFGITPTEYQRLIMTKKDALSIYGVEVY